MRRVPVWFCTGMLVATLGRAGDADPALVDRLQSIRERHDIPGLALIVVDRDGIRQALALGVADRATGRPMTVDTLVRIGSITKTFNALAMLRLEANGALSLEDPVRTFLPAVPLVNPWQAQHPVRLIHLIEHTAGLKDMSREEFAHNEPFASLRDAFAFRPALRRVHWPPGHFPEYSNVGSGYLGLVIEGVSGLSYEAYMRDEILRPLGLSSATLRADRETLRRLATGYDSDGHTAIPYWHMVFPPLGAINATPREMAGLPLLFLRRGELPGASFLAPQTIERMQRPGTSAGARAGLRYGYGLGLEQEIDGGYLWYGHEGDGDGYLSHFAYQPALGVGYFLTFNAFKRDALRELKHALRVHLAGLPAPNTPDAVPVAGAPPDAALGTYRQLTSRFDWERGEARLSLIRRADGLHIVYPRGERRPLLPVTDGLFRQPGQPVATVALVEIDGRWILQGDFGNFGKP